MIPARFTRHLIVLLAAIVIVVNWPLVVTTMNTEPAITIGSIVALVAAVITLLVAFGVEVTNDQRDAILAIVSIGGPLVAAVLIRRKVTPA